MRLGYQMILKSPPLSLLVGSAPDGISWESQILRTILWIVHKYALHISHSYKEIRVSGDCSRGSTLQSLEICNQSERKLTANLEPSIIDDM